MTINIADGALFELTVSRKSRIWSQEIRKRINFHRATNMAYRNN